MTTTIPKIITKHEIHDGVIALAAVAEAISELKSVPAGLVYSQVMHKMDLEAFNKLVKTLCDCGLVERSNQGVLTWIGPDEQRQPPQGDWSTRNRTGLYNNDVELFRNAKPSYRLRRISLFIKGGMINAGKDGWVARFESNEAAEACLRAAGYTNLSGNWLATDDEVSK